MKQAFGYTLLVGIILVCWGGSYHFFALGDTTGGFVCFGIGSIFAALLIFSIGYEFRIKSNRAFVDQSYEVVMTELDHVEALGTDLFYVHTKWVDPDGGEVFYFKSTYLEFNPERYLKGKDIPVKISLSDYKRYVVDLSMLPKKV